MGFLETLGNLVNQARGVTMPAESNKTVQRTNTRRDNPIHDTDRANPRRMDSGAALGSAGIPTNLSGALRGESTPPPPNLGSFQSTSFYGPDSRVTGFSSPSLEDTLQNPKPGILASPEEIEAYERGGKERTTQKGPREAEAEKLKKATESAEENGIEITGGFEKGGKSNTPASAGKRSSLTDRDAFNDWMADRSENGLPVSYDSFEDFQFAGNNSDDWLDFMKYTYDNGYGGMYDFMLGDDYLGADFFDYDPADSAALEEKRAAYADWYNPWVGDHSVDNILAGDEKAYEILGSYGGTGESVANYLADNNFAFIPADMDPNGEIDFNSIIWSGENGENRDDFVKNAENIVNLLQMQGAIRRGDKLSENELDKMFSSEEGAIDFGRLGSYLPGSDQQYATADTGLTDEQIAQILSTNFSDASLYLNNPDYANMVAAALASTYGGYGTNLAADYYSPEAWASIAPLLAEGEESVSEK